MKRLAGILMLGIYMLSFMELHNLLRIPVFIAHFQEHQEKDESTTLWGFFREHYVGPVVVDDDYDRDQQLPFRDADCCIAILSYNCECSTTSYEIIRPDTLAKEFALYRERSKRILPPYDFFQPPRFA